MMTMIWRLWASRLQAALGKPTYTYAVGLSNGGLSRSPARARTRRGKRSHEDRAAVCRRGLDWAGVYLPECAGCATLQAVMER